LIQSMYGRTFKILIALYFALYLCLLIPGHLAQFAGAWESGQTVQTSHHEDSHHDHDHCTICLTSGQVAAITFDCPLCAYRQIARLVFIPVVSTATAFTDLSTDPRAPPTA